MPGLPGIPYTATMDLTSGYNQALLSMACRAFTAFITFAGVYQFTRLPFGPKRAPSYFQEQMATVVLAGMIYIICDMYLDDCIVYGTGTDEFCERLEKLFIRFDEKHIFLKAIKCKLGMSEVEYVGKTVSKDGLRMSECIDSIKYLNLSFSLGAVAEEFVDKCCHFFVVQ